MEPIIIARITVNVPQEQIVYEFVNSYIDTIEIFHDSYVGFGRWKEDKQIIVYEKNRDQTDQTEDKCFADVWIDVEGNTEDLEKYIDKVIGLHTHHRDLVLNQVD